MSINGVMNSTSSPKTDTTYASKSKPTQTNSSTSNTASSSSTQTSSGVIYEHGQSNSSSSKIYKPDTKLVAKLKSDAEQKTAQFRQMVESMLTKQGKVFNQNDSIWKTLASGNFTVDKATQEAAAKEIGEDGYWGVNQTSDRILSFAEALTGGDPEKMEKMRDAFIKGYKQATGAWGKDLPSISGKTYDAVMKKFDDFGDKVNEVE